MNVEPLNGTMTDTDISIRAAVPDDAPLIFRFIAELADYERLTHAVVATPETIGAALFGERPFAEVVIAEHAGEPVGFALFFHNFSTFVGRPGLYLEDLFVRPDKRGLGIGRELLRHLAGLAVQRGCGRMEWSVLDWNAPAIGFYQGLGAVPMEEWTVFRLDGEALETLGGGR